MTMAPEGDDARDRGFKLGIRQLGALLTRQWLVKRRAPRAALFEICAPVLLFSLLVLGAHLATVMDYPSEVYADKGLVNTSSSAWRFFKDLVELESRELCEAVGPNLTAAEVAARFNASTNGTAGSADGGLSPPSPPPSLAAEGLSLFARLATTSPGAATAARDTQAFLVSRLGLANTVTLESALFAVAASPADPNASLAVIRELQHQTRAGVDLGLGPYWSAQLADLDTSSWNATVADAVARVTPNVVGALLSNNAPLPIPSFDEFAALGYAATFALESNAAFRQLYKRATSLGIQALGNLLRLGKVAFAPDTPAVRQLVAHLNTSHSFFKNHYSGVYSSEAAAVSELNKGGKSGLWAIVAMRDGWDGAKDAPTVHPVGSGTGTNMSPNKPPPGGYSEPCAGGPHCARYAIRMRFTTVPGTWNAFDRFSRVSQEYLKYYTSGFLTLQHAVDNALLRMAAGVAPGDVTTFVGSQNDLIGSSFALLMPAPPVPWGVPFPQSALSRNTFYDALGPLLGLLMCMSLMYPLGLLIKGLVEEKETRSQELMSIMGLQQWTITAAHAATYAVVFFLVAVLASAILNPSVFPTTDQTVLAAFLLCFMTAAVPLGFLIAAFFSRARLASIVGPFALFAMVMPRYVFFQTAEQQALSAKRAASLLAPTAFTFAADLLATREGANRGVTWATLYDDPFSLGELMGLLLFDALLYAVLAWYLGRVLPTAYGTPLPWWFVFSPKFWRWPASDIDSAKRSRLGRNPGSALWDANGDLEEGHVAATSDGIGAAAAAAEAEASANGAAVEPVAVEAGIAPAVVVRGLGKTYNPRAGGGDGSGMFDRLRDCLSFADDSRPVHAVKPLSLALYEGQITGLLGPNGAGKSTTIAMLTGMTPPTTGDALIMGHSLRMSLSDARRTLGVCPQMNVLFPALTCAEHLRMFATIKGVAAADVETVTREKLREVGLEAKADARSSTLSGGMKRRLQMAMALVGPSRVVLLDEPTSGLDPVSRRDAWRLIRAAAKGRCIVLTTHFLEEADLLCDRVAIISDGRLRCAGSPPFLKNSIGGSYALTLTFDGTGGDDGVQGNRSTVAQAESAMEVVKQHVPDATLRRARGGEATVELPASAADAFPALFALLEACRTVGDGAAAKDAVGDDDDADPDASSSTGASPVTQVPEPTSGQPLRLRGYGVSMTTLEEVFLRLAEDDRAREERDGVLAESPQPAERDAAIGCLSMGMNTATTNRDRTYRTLDDDLYQLPKTANGGEGDARRKVLPASTRPGLFAACVSEPRPRDEVELALFDNPLAAVVDDRSPSVAGDADSSDKRKGLGVRAFGEKGGTSTDRTGRLFYLGKRGQKQLVDLRQMLRKRYVIARRDRRGFFFQTILPIIVNVMVMCVLFLEVDPTGPSRDMSVCMFTETFGAHGGGIASVPVAGNDTSAATALAWAFNATGGGACAAGEVPSDIVNGVDMSLWLLNSTGASPTVPGAPRYLAMVRDDPLTPKLNITHCTAAAGAVSTPALARSTAVALTESAGLVPADREWIADAAGEVARVLERYGNEPLLVLHNTSAPHALSAALSATHSAIARNITGDNAARIAAVSHPLPLTSAEKESLRVWMNTLAAYFLLLPFSYLAATYASFVVKECATQATLLQLASGCDLTMYWMGAALWEWANHALICFATWIMFFVFDMTSLIGSSDKAMSTLVLLLAYGASAVPLSFIYSLGFTDHATTIVALSLVNFVTGFVLVNADFILRNSEQAEIRATGETLSNVWRLFPPFLLGQGLVAISTSQFQIDTSEKDETESWLDSFQGSDSDPSPFLWELAGRPIFLLCLQAWGYFTLLIVVQRFRSLARQRGLGLEAGSAMAAMVATARSAAARNDASEDEDVTQEARIVRAAVTPDEFDIVIDGLTKVYRTRGNAAAPDSSVSNHGDIFDREVLPYQSCAAATCVGGISGLGGSLCAPPATKVAVDNLTLGVRRGERFGLLGVNGAGKSSTLKVLCGDHPPTSGAVAVCGHSVSTNLRKVQRVLGYCPQFDPLLELMTGTETVTMYARLKGISAVDAPPAAAAIIASVGLAHIAHRPCGEYSGGNKRKLSLAMALVGGPRVLLLDEPSSGMCPLGRRMMWDTIERAADGLTVVLTTHAMDECEALCERIGVMAAGKLRCLGSAQHLKGRFGKGYVLDMKVASTAEAGMASSRRVEAVTSAVVGAAAAGEIEVFEQQAGRVKLRIKSPNALAGVFSAIERCRAEGKLENYAVMQSSLEDVFVEVCKPRHGP